MLAQVRGKGMKAVGGRIKLEKGFLAIAVEGLEWISEADSRKNAVT